MPMENEIDHATLKARFMDASDKLAATLEPEVFTRWREESYRFIEATARGEEYTMSPLASAIYTVVWEHVTVGTKLRFPPEVAAHYARAPKAPCN
jgi:hypothetical protein